MNWFKNLSVRTKMFLGLGAISTMMVFAAMYVVLQMSEFKSDVHAYSLDEEKIASSKNLQLRVANIWQFATDASLVKDKSSLDSARKNQQQANTEIDKLLSLSKDDNQIVSELNKTKVDLDKILETGSEMFGAYTQSEEMGNEVMGKFDKVCDQLIEEVNLIAEKAQQEASVSFAEMNQMIASQITMTSISIGIIILLTIGTSLFVTRWLTGYLQKLVSATEKILKGDLDVTVSINSKDEFGILANSFNKMVENIRKANQELREEKAGVERKVEDAVKESEEQRNYLERNAGKLLVEMDNLANGDLTVQLEKEKNDVIGSLFDGFNKVVLNMKEMIEQVTAAVEATASASSEISSSSEEMAAGSQEQSAQTTEIASAVEEMTKTILETSQNSSKSAEAAKSAGTIAKEGGKVVDQTIEGMNRVAEVVKKSAETVNALGKGSDQIGEIVQVINDIADQTNLLALNAAIEAARAGEQGRGFAVVADEVRKLAERTTKATKEIAVMIKQIQKDTGGAVESMNRGTEEVERGKALADKAGQSLKEIIVGVEQVVDMSTQVAAASEEQSSAAEQISKNIEAISSVTQESAAGIQQIARAAEDLNRLTVNLQELTSRFKIDKKVNISENRKVTEKSSNKYIREESIVKNNGWH
ncbi:MAG: HAMP domain-containing methyl-accepting chemotaxis protein [Ignavibacteriaceae bacterium]|jgi:methyl-accepting chemotaxis protein